MNRIDVLGDINDRYLAIECELEQKLHLVLQKERTLSSEENEAQSQLGNNVEPCTMDTAKERNHAWIKSLEIVKARLRSRALYSPLETILQKAISNYRREMSLVPYTTKKVYALSKISNENY